LGTGRVAIAGSRPTQQPRTTVQPHLPGGANARSPTQLTIPNGSSIGSAVFAYVALRHPISTK